ncbi:MAG TPA: hypothetical protein EYO73_05475 [Sulfurimonas sp.]|nr:hypothetical protein [Sulfurimonas sp.]
MKISKKGFGLWQAIMIILIISGLMMVVLKYSRIAAEHTADTYVRQQLELYLNSVVEMTLLEISLRDKTNCISNDYSPPTVEKRKVIYSANVEVTKYYLLSGVPEFGINNVNCSAMIINIESEETHGMVMIEIEALATIDGNVISRILRRTLQRP